MQVRHIDPTNLSYEDAVILRQLLEQNSLHQVLKEQQVYELLALDEESTGQICTHRIMLTHPIVIRKSTHSPNEYRYEVMGEIIGKGSFGEVRKVICTLEPLEDGSLWAKSYNKRVIKIEAVSKEEFYKKVRECHITNISGELKAKCPIMLERDEQVVSYSVLEFISGQTLFELLIKEHNGDLSLTLEQRMAITLQAILSLDKLHKNGVIHRDLSANNIFIDLATSEIHIFDFGLSALLEEKTQHEKMVTEEVINPESQDENKEAEFHGGTPDFAPPEVYIGLKADQKSDIFSLALIIALLWHAEQMNKNSDADPNYENNFNDILDYDFKGLASSLLEKKHIRELKAILLKMFNSQRDQIEDVLGSSITGIDELFQQAVDTLRQQRSDLNEVYDSISNLFLNFLVASKPSKLTMYFFQARICADSVKNALASINSYEQIEKIISSALMSMTANLDVKYHRDVLATFSLFLGIKVFSQCTTCEAFSDVLKQIKVGYEMRMNKLTQLQSSLNDEIIRLKSNPQIGRAQEIKLRMLESMCSNVTKMIIEYNKHSFSDLDAMVKSFAHCDEKVSSLQAKLTYINHQHGFFFSDIKISSHTH